MKTTNSKRKIYIFDFDNTISDRDSFIQFTYYSINSLSFLRYWIKILLLYPFYSRSKLKELFYGNFKLVTLEDFNFICSNFSRDLLKRSIKDSFLNYLETIKDGSEFVVVSASIHNYLKPWCEEMQFELICTELEVKNGRLTGKFITPNCNGKEKVRRINMKYNLSEYDEVHVFGNSSGDIPMLELGTHKYYKFFK